MEETLIGLISALVAVILTLIGLLKYYLPRQVAKNNQARANPDLAEIRQSLQRLLELTIQQSTEAKGRHQEIIGSLRRIEERLK